MKKNRFKFRAWDKFTKTMWQWENHNAFSIDKGSIKQWFENSDLFQMQFTGLFDKNGKEIYEGDILKHDLWGNSHIIWEHGMFRGIGNDHDVTLADHQLKRSKVIGNIYENPELSK